MILVGRDLKDHLVPNPEIGKDTFPLNSLLKAIQSDLLIKFFTHIAILFALALLIIIMHPRFSVLICAGLFLFDLGVSYEPNYLLCRDEARCCISCQVMLKTRSYLTYLMILKLFNQFGHLTLLPFFITIIY